HDQVCPDLLFDNKSPAIAAGTMFWARYAALRPQTIVATQLRRNLTSEWQKDCAFAHALECFFPTMIRSAGRALAVMPPAPKVIVIQGSGLGDLPDQETRRHQAELVRDHGVFGFMYTYYWPQGPGLILQDGQLDMPFFLSWINEPGTNNNLQENDWRQHFASLLPLFNHPNFMKEDGKPMLAIDGAFFINNNNKNDNNDNNSDKNMSELLPPMLRLWDVLANESGFPGLHFVATGPDINDTAWPSRDFDAMGSDRLEPPTSSDLPWVRGQYWVARVVEKVTPAGFQESLLHSFNKMSKEAQWAVQIRHNYFFVAGLDLSNKSLLKPDSGFLEGLEAALGNVNATLVAPP
ncbi:unnamed protein product, partial [Polarella glacialis]